MKAAIGIDKKICNDLVYKDLESRFLGTNEAFTCTAVLSSKILQYCKKFPDYNQLLSGIIPTMWL